MTDLAFTRDGTHLAIATFDRTGSTRIWDWHTREELLSLTEGGVRVAFSPDGKPLAGVRPEPVPSVRVWALDPERLLEIARSRVTRSLTEDECRQYLQGPCPGD